MHRMGLELWDSIFRVKECVSVPGGGVWTEQTDKQSIRMDKEENELCQCSGRAYPSLWGMMPHH